MRPVLEGSVFLGESIVPATAVASRSLPAGVACDGFASLDSTPTTRTDLGACEEDGQA